MESGTIFLDKDGTVVEDVPYNVDPDRISLAPGVEEGLCRLKRAGYRLVVVTNQSGVAHGYFPETALQRVEARLQTLFNEAGAELGGFYYCPHHPEGAVPAYRGACSCRKPAPGLLQKAAGELELTLDRSWMVGDILNDVEAGRRANCRTVLIDNGNETEWILSRQRLPHYVVPTLAEAAGVITAADSRPSAPRAPVADLLHADRR